MVIPLLWVQTIRAIPFLSKIRGRSSSRTPKFLEWFLVHLCGAGLSLQKLDEVTVLFEKHDDLLQVAQETHLLTQGVEKFQRLQLPLPTTLFRQGRDVRRTR